MRRCCASSSSKYGSSGGRVRLSTCAMAASSAACGTAANAVSRRLAASTEPSSTSAHTLLKVSAAASRSRRLRNRASRPLRMASENILVTSRSNRSSTSSCALASSDRMNASKVATRRSSGIRATACALAAPANRANASTRVLGSRSVRGKPSASCCTSSRRSTARASSAVLCRVGPDRSRSIGLCRPPSGTTRSASSRSFWSRVIRAASNRQSRLLARARTREMDRSRTLDPGSSTLCVTSQAVARSNKALGRSVPVQHSA